MPALKLNPTTPTPASVVNVSGSEFRNLKTRLLLDGVGATTNVFRPDKNGWFQVGITVSGTAKTQTLVAQQQSGGVWSEAARISVPVTKPTTEPVPEPPPPPPPPDWRIVSGWTNVYGEDFNYSVPKGQLTVGGTVLGYYLLPDGTISLTDTGGVRKTAGVKTADGRFLVFGTSTTAGGWNNWPDTAGHGTYADPSIVSVHDGILDMEFYADANGYGHTVVLTPLPAGGSFRGGLVGGRSLIRFRADPVAGFKAVPLWWSDTAFANNMLPDGEIDGPEADLDKVPKWYMHYTNASSSGDQAWGSYPSTTKFSEWHDYVTEWLPGRSVRYYLDGQLVGEVTQRIPTVAMHFNLQFETSTHGTVPAPNARGHVHIERVGLWVPA